MKKTNLIQYIFICMFAIATTNQSYGQVSISGAIPAGINNTYTSLTNTGGAFEALNGATGGTITVTITSDLLIETGTTVLNDRSWSSLRIIPSGNRTISGTKDAGAIITLNGADSVTIDGIMNGTSSLIIQNLSTSSTAETSTIKIYYTAKYNTITNCTVLGSSTTDNSTKGGTIYLGSYGSLSGNDYNTISNCKIGNSSAGVPSKGIYSYGSSSGNENSFNTVTQCEIYNYGATTAIPSNGIYIYSGNTNWTISHNKFYQTSPISLSAKQCAILFTNITSTGNIVEYNTIGGDNSSGSGLYTITPGSANNKFSGICISQSGTVQYNTIANISQTTGDNSVLSLAFCGIEINGSALINANHNQIGSQTTTGSILFTGAGSGRCEVYGIYNGNTGQGGTISDNTLGGITLANSSTGGVNFDGISTNFNSTLSLFCDNNIIGGDIENSIHNTSNPAGAQARMFGIGFIQTKVVSCKNNIIRNLTSVGGPGVGSELCGIYAGSDKSKNISKNNIYQLSYTGTGSKDVIGIYHSGASSVLSLIEKNFIHTLKSNTSNGGDIVGIKLFSTSTTQLNTVINNIVTVSQNTTNADVYGIQDNCSQTSTNKIYHNTVSFTGTTVNGTSMAYYSSVSTTNSRDVRDNIFYNTRTGGTENLSMKVITTTSLTEDYNNLKGGVSGLTMGIHSLINDPLFLDPTSIIAEDYTPSNTLNALSSPINSTVPDDYFGNIRSGNPKMGAIEKSSSTLPVSLILFTATCENEIVEIVWETATEVNNDYFEVEASTDGKDWQFITKVSGAGNSNSLVQYKVNDFKNKKNQLNYYRLKQVDFDGRATLYAPISTSCFNEEILSGSIHVFPNPAIDHLFIDINSPKNSEGMLIVTSMTGAEVFREKINLMIGLNHLEINTDHFPQNTYVVTLSCEEFFVPSIRFVIVK